MILAEDSKSSPQDKVRTSAETTQTTSILEEMLFNQKMQIKTITSSIFNSAAIIMPMTTKAKSQKRKMINQLVGILWISWAALLTINNNNQEIKTIVH